MIVDVADLIFLLVVVAFFAVALAVVAACDRIAAADRAEDQPVVQPGDAP